MKLISTILATAMLLTGIAQAHSSLTTSTPAKDAVLSESPTQIALQFSHPIRLTALKLQKDSDAAQKLEPLPTAAAAELAVPVKSLAPGKYTVSWRAVGADNHVMSGEFQFSVKAPAK